MTIALRFNPAEFQRYQPPVSMPDFAHAPLGAVVVGDVAAGRWVERGHSIHQEAVHVASARQFHFGVPDTVDPLVHATSQGFVGLGQVDNQRNVLRAWCVQLKGNRFGVVTIL